MAHVAGRVIHAVLIPLTRIYLNTVSPTGMVGYPGHARQRLLRGVQSSVHFEANPHRRKYPENTDPWILQGTSAIRDRCVCVSPS